MKCVLFGGGGFIGSAVADRLLLDGHFLRIFERPRVEPYRKFETYEYVEWMTGDLLSAHDVSDAIDGVDVVLHLVSTTLPKSSNDDPIYDVQSNLVATLQLLNTMVEKKIPKIVFISSGGTVYGTPVYLPIDERHPTDPLVSYGITKLAIEKYLLMFERIHGIKSIILRVANPFGERQRIETAQGAIGVFLNRALCHQPIDIWGNGSITRDYIYISDVADAFACALSYSGQKSVFNISSGKGTSIHTLIALIEDVLNQPIEYRHLPERPFDVPISILSNELARQELGWAPNVQIREGIVRTAAWIKKTLPNRVT
ncbi:UDP-glucose 4-epimerase [Nitrosospira sp. Nsp5]|uniref:UDP-glucose 4-epimerase n=1 Tax=Nitrosospira multiformis TaxID=1231 RepID=A0ABY0T7B4_9PROT|nr:MULTISPECIES: NAD-dependent epimerase/dehydratase family protein [Nitrosospira]PTR09611.1 UDP-glucose 4-epimerase [Nitrosospira sp. Nsp5]SDQ26197.1 UDP-glucose 4-epimerase [Nitrosospira multiformis]